MALHGRRCILMWMILISLSVGTAQLDNSDLQQKYNSVVTEVEKLQDTVQTLRTEMVQFHRISRALTALCTELGTSPDGGTEDESGAEDGNEGGGLSSGKGRPTGEPADAENKIINEFESPIHFTSVEFYNDGDENIFHVNYAAMSKPESKWRGSDFDSPISGNNTFDNGNGTLDVESSDDRVNVVLYASSWKERIILVHNESVKKVDIEPFRFNINFTEEIVFCEGESTVIKVETGTEDANLQYSFIAYIRNSSMSEALWFHHNNNLPEAFKRLQENVSANSTKHVFALNSGGHDYEGLLTIGILKYVQHSPVQYHYLGKVIKVRRDDHKKPFPDGFLSFVEIVDTNGEMICEKGSDCRVYAWVVGNDVVDVTLWHKKSNEVFSKMSNDVTKTIIRRNKLTAVFKIHNVSKSDQGSYMFKATGKSGKVKQKTFQLNVRVYVTILVNMSRILEHSHDRLVVQCVARGYPAPDIMFEKNGHEPMIEGPGVRINQETDQREDLITGILTLEGQHDDVRSITCSAGFADSLSIDIPAEK